LFLGKEKLVEIDIVFRNILHSGFTWGGALVWWFDTLFSTASQVSPPGPAENDGLVRSLGLSTGNRRRESCPTNSRDEIFSEHALQRLVL
jgi:hypothetical protein